MKRIATHRVIVKHSGHVNRRNYIKLNVEIMDFVNEIFNENETLTNFLRGFHMQNANKRVYYKP